MSEISPQEGGYIKKVTISSDLPRLPRKGSIDLTYRCNNHCRHCWLWQAETDPAQDEELSLDEIKLIADEARSFGCQEWNISGGEPMLRPDFIEIFDYITSRSKSYGLNSNGTLITPEIAKMMRRKGSKLIALYGATAEVYDHITRNPGGFEQAMRGFAYLQEAGAGFTVQLIPMRGNWHQWDQMQALAASLSKSVRVGASWLYLSCDASPARNKEIAAQRLPPEAVIELDPPNISYNERLSEIKPQTIKQPVAGGGLFANCIASRRDFHIDPYGKMSWCSFIKDPDLRYDLRKGSFKEAWEVFIPSCADKVPMDQEWQENCGSCDDRGNCKWCGVYAYLETGRYSAPIPYLCQVAEEARQFKAAWPGKHRRYFGVAGITIRVESELDFNDMDFKDELKAFAVDGPGEDNVTLRHHFSIPELSEKDLGEVHYHRAPWSISHKNGTWFYRGISPGDEDAHIHRLAVFNPDHTRGEVYSPPRERESLQKHGFNSLTLFPTDQILLCPLLADRQAVLLHAAAAVINGRGFVFVGHSDAGKSTTMELLKSARGERGLEVEILCDDRNILRKWPEGWRVHGTWSHGTTADVSAASAPLAGILFLEQAQVNEIVPLTDRKQVWRGLLATLIRALVTAAWWEKQLDTLEEVVADIPAYRMRFDKTGDIVKVLERLSQAQADR